MNRELTTQSTIYELVAQSTVNELNHHHRKANAAARLALEHAKEAGRILQETKAALPHGAWGPWLKQNFEGSERTARRYMQVYRRWPELETNGHAWPI